jgi:Ca2+-transporting ATPase
VTNVDCFIACGPFAGESVAVLKTADAISDRSCELQAKENMLFSGTAIANGIVVGVVTATGMNTEIGKIQSQIKEASEENDDTPLKKKLDEFGEMLAKVHTAWRLQLFSPARTDAVQASCQRGCSSASLLQAVLPC